MTLTEIIEKAIPLNDECPLKRARAAERRIQLKQRLLCLLQKTHNFTQTEMDEYIKAEGSRFVELG